MAVDDSLDWYAGFAEWAVSSRVCFVIRDILGTEDGVDLLVVNFIGCGENRSYTDHFTTVILDTLECGLQGLSGCSSC